MYPHHLIHHFPINFVPNWCDSSELQVNTRVKPCTPITFLHQSGYILGTHDFGFYYYFTNIVGVFLIYLHWKHGLSYTFEIQWMLDSLTGGIFRGLCGGVSPLARVTSWTLQCASSFFTILPNDAIDYPGIDFKNKK